VQGFFMFVYFKKIAALMRALVDGAQVDWLERERERGDYAQKNARQNYPSGRRLY